MNYVHRQQTQHVLNSDIDPRSSRVVFRTFPWYATYRLYFRENSKIRCRFESLRWRTNKNIFIHMLQFQKLKTYNNDKPAIAIETCLR